MVSIASTPSFLHCAVCTEHSASLLCISSHLRLCVTVVALSSESSSCLYLDCLTSPPLLLASLLLLFPCSTSHPRLSPSRPHVLFLARSLLHPPSSVLLFYLLAVLPSFPVSLRRNDSLSEQSLRTGCWHEPPGPPSNERATSRQACVTKLMPLSTLCSCPRLIRQTDCTGCPVLAALEPSLGLCTETDGYEAPDLMSHRWPTLR
jgi:hypothetical protein